jgi:hypothetical protein
MIFSTGLRPLAEPRRAFAVVHCNRCFQAIVYAWDDMFPQDESELFKRAVNLEEMPPENGHVVLWYQVDQHGQPIGRQMFTRWEERSGYAGPTWILHASTCQPQKGGLHHARR